MDLRIPEKKFVCVDYPAIVRNHEAMLNTLGGVAKVTEVRRRSTDDWATRRLGDMTIYWAKDVPVAQSSCRPIGTLFCITACCMDVHSAQIILTEKPKTKP